MRDRVAVLDLAAAAAKEFVASVIGFVIEVAPVDLIEGLKTAAPFPADNLIVRASRYIANLACAFRRHPAVVPSHKSVTVRADIHDLSSVIGLRNTVQLS